MYDNSVNVVILKILLNKIQLLDTILNYYIFSKNIWRQISSFVQCINTETAVILKD